MGISLAALLIMGVFFTGVLMMYQATLFGNVVVSNAMKESSNLELARSRTLLGITEISGGTSNPSTFACFVAVAVANQGNESISDFQRMDVIAHFEGHAPMSFKYTDSVTGAMESGDWTIVIDPAIYPFEPSIFNPGEKATIYGKLELGPQALIAAVVGTPNGVVANFSGTVDVNACEVP